ncbi:hypothetical protein BE21_04600 [Sorangium cellulosum]|uniref:Uncharacterized protein n=1 Tax=Sorangium cellulosum TaxID=56 RepID=A0A150TFM4_SORCE|nr:hypothetical protein BE21_04600 [Sorangium cellulosum]
MPLIIGEIDARIEVIPPDRPAPAAGGSQRLTEADAARARELAAQRLERERRIEQRDPNRLGGR